MLIAAANEVSESTFQIYAIALIVSGALLLLMAAIGFGATTGSRVVSALVGLAMLGYGVYLEFFFQGGEFRMFYYVFIVPIVLIINIIRSRKSKDAAPTA